jgi:predicted butyrate kinase (DUF1464 family)
VIKILTSSLPLDAIVGPSGYGLPLTHIKDTDYSSLKLMLPKESSVPVNDAIEKFWYFAKENALPVYFTPGVIHLQTVPFYRKLNRIDMGTADKLCCVVVALEQVAKDYNLRYDQCSFVFLEIGYGFTAAIGVENGKVVDGVGGTSGFCGFLSPGGIDTELAIRMGKQLQDVVFTGGAKSLAKEIELEELDRKKHEEVWNALMEGAVKDVAIVKTTTKGDKIVISGRLSGIPQIREELYERLSLYGEVIFLRKKGKYASHAAYGAVMIGNGILGGEYKELIETMELNKAKGTMYDYIKMEVEYER